MNLQAILQLLIGMILVLFCGVMLVLRFDPVFGGALTVLLGVVVMSLGVLNRRWLERVLRLLLLPLLGPAARAKPAVEAGPIYSFLSIELDRRERTAAVAACMAVAAQHGARMGGGRPTERGRAAATAALKHNFGLGYQSEWIGYITRRTESLLAGMDPTARERSLDEVIGLCMEMLPARESRERPRENRETRALLFVMIYQALLIDGVGINSEALFERIGRRHGLNPGEIEANKAAGRYYLHAFRNRKTSDDEPRKEEASGRRANAQNKKAGGKSERSGTGRGRNKQGQKKQGRARQPAGATTNEAPGELLRLFDLAPGYDERALNRAWKRILHAHHPDRHHGGDEASRQTVHEQFIRMQRGYETLQRNLKPTKAV